MASPTVDEVRFVATEAIESEYGSLVIETCASGTLPRVFVYVAETGHPTDHEAATFLSIAEARQARDLLTAAIKRAVKRERFYRGR